MLLSCVEQSFPSHSSNAQMMSESAHPASWYSLPNCHGFCGTNINPGQVYSLTHLLMLSSMQLIQLSTKLSAIFLFQQSNISHTSQNRSWNSGGFLFMYVRSMQQFTICKRVSGYLLVDSINNGIQDISGKHTIKKLKVVIIFSIDVKIYFCFVVLHIGSSSITKSTMSPCFFERRNHCIIWLWNIFWNGFIIIIYINHIDESCNCLCGVNFTISVIILHFWNGCVFGFVFIFLVRLDSVKEIV